MDYYVRFIKPHEIRRDINFFFNQIKELICNDLFSQFMRDNRKKIHKNYVVKDYLSKFDKTRLQFNNDTINVEFLLDPANQKTIVAISPPKFKSYKLDGICIVIKICLKKSEYKNKMIYQDNEVFNELRKNITGINKYYCDKLNQREITKSKYIYPKLIEIKKSPYEVWNSLIKYTIDALDPDFDDQIKKYQGVLMGIKNKEYIENVKIIHQTELYLKYSHQRQIKINRFMKKLSKDILDDQEIVDLTKSLASCFNHKIIDYKESINFITDIIEHYNYIYHTKEETIDNYVYKIWSKKTGRIDSDD